MAPRPLYASLCDGLGHNYHILAGKGAGTIRTGRHVRCRDNTPLATLPGEIAARIGLHLPQFADGTGGLKALAG